MSKFSTRKSASRRVGVGRPPIALDTASQAMRFRIGPAVVLLGSIFSGLAAMTVTVGIVA